MADLDAFISATVAAQHAIGVTVGVMRDGQVIFAKGYGLARVADKTPVATETLFAVGSVTKQFTCAVALQLEQEQKLSFDDRIARYEPGLTRAADITVRDIGGMVSGYRDYYPLDFVDRPMAAPRASLDIVRDFASRPLDFEPRARYSYSNTGYLLLGAHCRTGRARAVRARSSNGVCSRRSACVTRATSRSAAAPAWPRATRRSASATSNRRCRKARAGLARPAASGPRRRIC